jgi:phosphatidylglycerol:prolipoprotein diacylglycerol transferase
MALAALTAAWVVSAELKRYNLNSELASTIVFAAAYRRAHRRAPAFHRRRVARVSRRARGATFFTGAGFTWYGGFFGGAAGVSWVPQENKIPWLVGADIGAPALASAYGVGRIGCHVAGDGDWGAVTDVPWGVAYTNAIVGWADPNTGIPYGPGVRVHPTPIYEFLLGVVVFGILWSLRKKKLAPGTLAWLYLILTGMARFVVEFWRINPAIGFGFSEAQWFSLILMMLGLFLLLSRPARVKT